MSSCSQLLTLHFSAMKVTIWYEVQVWLLILGPAMVACFPTSFLSSHWWSSPYMLLTPFLPLHAGREAPMHGITQEPPSLPLPMSHPEQTHTASLCVPKDREQLHSISQPWVHFFSSYTHLDAQGPQHHGHGWQLPSTLHRPHFSLSCPHHKQPQDQRSGETGEFGNSLWPPGGETVGEEGKVGREGGEMKWWEKLEAGSTVWAEGDSEVKGSSPFMLNCE